MAQDQDDILTTIAHLQNQPLSIIRLAEPFSSGPQPPTRSSDVSSSSITAAAENPSPASLEADLTHYKELFSKLRFSYLEQVTKEKFLRSIVGEPPLIVEHQENVELEVQLAEVKKVLRQQKEGVADLVRELEEKGRDICGRYETISLQTTLLSDLPQQITSLNETLTNLNSQLSSLHHSSTSSFSITTPHQNNESLSLPLPATLSLLSTRQTSLSDLDQQIRTLQQKVIPENGRRIDVEERELRALEKEKEGKIGEAREAKRRKEGDGSGNGNVGGGEVELRGRWLRGQEGMLRAMVGVEAGG